MTADPTIRDNALSCEAKKHAYRQTQDGVVVSFVLHPSEIPDGLAIAPLGTRYMIALVEIGDDEQPKAGSSKGRTSDFESENEGLNPSPAAKWSTLTPAQQAGILCNDPAFEKFMSEVHNFTHADVPLMVRQHCNVDSRKDILPDSYAGRRWRELVSDYRAWCREPEVV